MHMIFFIFGKSSLVVSLKVNKNENFFGLDFEFCTFYFFTVSYAKILRFCKQKNFDRAIMGGVRIVLRSLKIKGNKKVFKLGQKI
jgi:hypothetical protein